MQTNTSTQQTATSPLFAVTPELKTATEAMYLALKIGLGVEVLPQVDGRFAFVITERPATAAELARREKWIKRVEKTCHGEITIAELSF